MTTVINNSKSRVSLKLQTLWAGAAAAGAVLLPQIFHAVGAVSGLGTTLGEAFLPMHLPVILVGMLAGPFAGALSGILAPIVSLLLSGMPRIVMVPFMTLELCSYGLFAGLLRNVNLPSFAKVLSVQFAGRAVRAIAILLAFYVFGSHAVPVSIIWTSVLSGLPGIILQLTLIPLIVYWAENRGKNER